MLCIRSQNKPEKCNLAKYSNTLKPCPVNTSVFLWSARLYVRYVTCHYAMYEQTEVVVVTEIIQEIGGFFFFLRKNKYVRHVVFLFLRN